MIFFMIETKSETKALKLSGKTITIPMNNKRVEYKKNIQESLKLVGKSIEGFYYNDKCNNGTSSRRIKFEVVSPLSEVDLGTFCGDLGNALGCVVDAKNYEYLNAPCVVAYLRK